MKDKYIGENMELIYDLTTSENILDLLVLIDFEVANDFISWQIFYRVLIWGGMEKKIQSLCLFVLNCLR